MSQLLNEPPHHTVGFPTDKRVSDLADESISDAPPPFPKVRATHLQVLMGWILTGIVMVIWLIVPPGIGNHDPRTRDRVARDVRYDIVFIANRVEAYRVATKRLPESLADMNVASTTVVYRRRTATTYSLVSTLPDTPVSYQSVQPLRDFVAGLRVGGAR